MHDRRLVAGGDDDVLRAGGAIEEVPLGKSPFLPSDEQGALARQDENASCAFSRWYIPIRSPGSSTLMLMPKCGNRRLPSKVQ